MHGYALPLAAGDGIARCMLQHRERVLLRWRQRACDELPAAGVLPEPLLLATMPALYDHLMKAIADPEGLGRTSLARAHGAGRARLDGYRASDVLYEFQLLRRCVGEVAYEENLLLRRDDMSTIFGAFDAAEREALDEFDAVRAREQELAFRTLAAALREHVHVAGIAAQRIMRSIDLARIGSLSNRIRTRLAQMAELLDGDALNDAAAQERLPLLLSTFDIAALAREVCAEWGLPGTSMLGDATSVTWCRMSMKQALRNLLGERGTAHGDLAVMVRSAHGRVSLSVRHGDVLPADVVRTLFSSRHKEAHPTLREWGVGLAFVRDVAESHGGSAIVHSTGGCTVFTLDLPADASPFMAGRS